MAVAHQKVALIALCLANTLLPFALAQHGHWVDKYYGLMPGGIRIGCCGTADCLPQPFRVLAQTKDTVTLDIQGQAVTLPHENFHTSEDTQDYLCLHDPAAPPTSANIRCAFIAPGG